MRACISEIVHACVFVDVRACVRVFVHVTTLQKPLHGQLMCTT